MCKEGDVDGKYIIGRVGRVVFKVNVFEMWPGSLFLPGLVFETVSIFANIVVVFVLFKKELKNIDT